MPRKPVPKGQLSIEYKPLPKQAAFHALSAKYRGFCGGWGNGKTSGCCVEFFASLLEYPGTRSIVARKTRPELKATTWDMLVYGDPSSQDSWHGIPWELVQEYNKSELYIKLRPVNGRASEIHGLPLDDPKKLENYNLGLFWIDQAEEVEEDILLKFQGRLRQHGAPREGLLSFNPAGHNWLWKRFIDPKRPDKWKRLYKCVEATTFDNPNLPPDYFDQFEGLPEHWYNRFVLGSHEVFVGQIFTDFNPDVHVIPPFRIPSSWERWMCIDPGIRHEGAACWIARDPDGRAFYYREHLEANQPVEWWAQLIFRLERESNFGGPDESMFRRLIGPEAAQRAQTDGKTVLDVFGEHGLYPERADKDPRARISKITQYLRPHVKNSHYETGSRPAPQLYVFADCHKMIEYLPQYRWKPQRTNFTEEEPPEAPRKKDDHNIDCLGHMLLAFDDLPPIEDHSKKTAEQLEQEWYEEHFAKALEDAREQGELAGVGHSILGDL